jgi:molybdopterin-guanine dinucleotide biosynthesis protein B
MTQHIFCIIGKKKAGKTTFLEKLVPELQKLGLSVGAVKHDAHTFEMDVKGKDSWRLKQAGAETVVVSSPDRVAMIQTVDRERSLEELAETLFADKDVVLAEGYFNSAQPKIEVFRQEAHDHSLCGRNNQQDKKLIAMVSDQSVTVDVPKFGLDEASEVAAHIARKYYGWVYNGMWATHD